MNRLFHNKLISHEVNIYFENRKWLNNSYIAKESLNRPKKVYHSSARFKHIYKKKQ